MELGFEGLSSGGSNELLHHLNFSLPSMSSPQLLIMILLILLASALVLRPELGTEECLFHFGNTGLCNGMYARYSILVGFVLIISKLI
jgi:hypothetical protein